ncbi:MAG: MotA/TolQ/ExbB proton channel family protein [bacterium]|nr:MotA/TolQ/ExbB proton channel family protein [bacterium]
MNVAGISLGEIMKISPVFDILLACLILAIIVGFERAMTYKRVSMDKVSFMKRIRESLSMNRYDEAVQYSAQENKPLPRMVSVALTNRDKSAEDIAELMEASRMEERVKLEKSLGVLGTLGNTAPFIGLLGTVIGIIRAFKLLEHSAGDPTVIMVGIAEALITTAMGLFVAIPCVMVFNAFMGKVKNWYTEMEVVSKELLAEMGAIPVKKKA